MYLQNKSKFPGYVESVLTSGVENIHLMRHTEVSVVVAHGYLIPCDKGIVVCLLNRSLRN